MLSSVWAPFVMTMRSLNGVETADAPSLRVCQRIVIGPPDVSVPTNVTACQPARGAEPTTRLPLGP